MITSHNWAAGVPVGYTGGAGGGSLLGQSHVSSDLGEQGVGRSSPGDRSVASPATPISIASAWP